MLHTVRLVATPVPRQPPSRPPSRSGVIGLPNPFKALMTTHLGAPGTVEITELVGRVEVDAQAELGVIPVEGAIIANRTILTNDGRRAIFWTESGLTVGNSRNHCGSSIHSFQIVQTQPGSLRELWSTTLPPVDAGWIDNSSFMLAYPVRVLYALPNVSNHSKPGKLRTLHFNHGRCRWCSHIRRYPYRKHYMQPHTFHFCTGYRDYYVHVCRRPGFNKHPRNIAGIGGLDRLTEVWRDRIFSTLSRLV